MLWRTGFWLLVLYQAQVVAKEAKELDKKGTVISGLVQAATTGTTDSWYQRAVGADETGTQWSQQGQVWLKKAKGKIYSISKISILRFKSHDTHILKVQRSVQD